ncbi:unnamed protein product [Heterosigma akashiwo]
MKIVKALTFAASGLSASYTNVAAFSTTSSVWNPKRHGAFAGLAAQHRASHGNVMMMNSKATVLFDFDGTIGDTETPAMKIAFWELAPYFVSAEKDGVLPDETAYVQDNAGKAFEFMMEVCEEQRAAAGLPSLAEARGKENPAVMGAVDAARSALGLRTFPEILAQDGALPDLLAQQKEETVEGLSKVAGPNPGVADVLARLTADAVPFAIATTSPKPRVPVSITSLRRPRLLPPWTRCGAASGLFTPASSGPGRLPPGRRKEGQVPSMCIAVEDSASGVGSASNAKMGLIVGYVGSSHIPAEKKASHAAELIAGTRAEDGRGADLVVHDFADLLPIVAAFQASRDAGEGPAQLGDRLKALESTFIGESWYNAAAFSASASA